MKALWKNSEILVIFLLNMIYLSYSTKISLGEKSNLKKNEYKVLRNFKLPNGPILAKGWFKYTTFTKDEKSKPKEFLKNLAFDEQMKNGMTIDLKDSDSVGYKNIPDEEHFFFILTSQAVSVLSARKEYLAKAVEVMRISEILNNTSTSEFEGGVSNHGDFLEGYCFQIKLMNDQRKKVIWEICADRQVSHLLIKAK